MKTKHVDLFGGAITCTIRSHWRDVSTVRQVPDNQEVYQDCNEDTGAVMVVEILQYQNIKDTDAAQFFFADLAESNGCKDGDWRLESSRVLGGNGATDDEEKCEEHVMHNILQTIAQSSSKNSCVVAVGSQNVVQGKAYTGTGVAAEKSIRVEMFILRLASVQTDVLVTLSTPVCSPPTSLSENFRLVMSTFSIKAWTLFG